MCFVLKSKRVKIAKSNITCYKVSSFQFRGKKTFRPAYRGGFQYKINIQTRKLRLIPIDKEIHIGYHAYKTKMIAVVEWGKDYRVIGKFIIPKGAQYYENDREYVSETLIFKGIV